MSEENVSGIEYEYRGASHEDSHAHLFSTVSELLSSVPPGSKVLDLGCGNGSFLSLFADRGWQRFGTDFSPSGIEIARKTYPDVHFFLADAESAIEEIREHVGYADAIIATEVIEHLYAPRAFLQTAYAVLKPGGLLVLTTPYHGYLKNLMLAATNSLDAHFTALWDHGHIKFWSRKTLTSVTTEAGFEPLEFKGSGRVPYLWKSMALLVRKPQEPGR
jgi:2-polyprenyl-6-hydroxyphenyl methylase/3-demethylubiquinone-9 3-methyltransferase